MADEGATPEAKKPWMPTSIPREFEVDKTARYQGTVVAYYKWSGYGFIAPDTPGLVPDGHLFVHWRNIQTDDRVPFLLKDMKVEFGMMKFKDHKHNIVGLRAKTVTLPGGGMVALQDEIDAQKKTFVGGQMTRYTGVLKFYNARNKFGYVTIDDGYAMEETVAKEIRVEEPEVNCAGRPPRRYLENLAVEFGIWKNSKGQHMVYNMTLPGGIPLTEENLEHRVLLQGSFQGTITSWSWQSKWGLLTPAPGAQLPPAVLAKMDEMLQTSQAKGKPARDAALYFRKTDLAKGCTPWIKVGQACTFQAYMDDKGAGACEIVVTE
mmetsp:Transcript_28191/g.49206  ORF Transcript_28191/g.49206 Transcript_28191/m.49206 type:complete len:321 (+) Transcript_28191:37-999(+)